MPAIKNKATLEKLIQRMYWLEAEMEQLTTWEARIELMDENVAALETLSHDSDRHADIMEKWLIKGNIHVPEEKPPGIPKHLFDFEGMAGPEIFSKMIKYELLMLNAYTDMKTADIQTLKELFPDENDLSEFLKDIEQLIRDEKRHVGICEKQVGGFTKVMY